MSTDFYKRVLRRLDDAVLDGEVKDVIMLIASKVQEHENDRQKALAAPAPALDTLTTPEQSVVAKALADLWAIGAITPAEAGRLIAEARGEIQGKAGLSAAEAPAPAEPIVGELSA